MNKFIFIAVNYNSSKYTIDYIKSVDNLKISETDDIRVIIVDNNSGSEDLEKLEKYCTTKKNINLVKSDVNLGYFKGLNLGIKKVTLDKNTFLIVGNNDLIFDKDFITNLKEIKYDKSVLVIAPNIITMEGRQQNPHVVDRVPFIEKLKTRLYFSNYYVGQLFRLINQNIKQLRKKPAIVNNNYKQMKIKRGIGACYILTPNFTGKFNKLDDRIFMWGEEVLLSHQVESVGGCTLYDPSIVVYHHESASVKKIESKKKYYMVRESYKIYKKYL